MSLLDLITDKPLDPFLAPYPERGTRLFTFQHDLPHWLDVAIDLKPSWYMFQPLANKREAVHMNQPVSPYQYLDYLEQLPRFLTYVAIPPEDDKVLVVPFNASDAKQRGWPNCQPRHAYLCGRKLNLPPLSVVSCRSMADLLLVEGPYTHTRTKTHILEEILSTATVDVRKGVFTTEEETAVKLFLGDQIQKKALSEEDEIRRLLGLAGAELSWYTKTDSGYEITWTHDGHRHRQPFDKNLHCQVAGICLAGGDRQQDLVTIVKVMEEARKQDRYDYGERPQ